MTATEIPTADAPRPSGLDLQYVDRDVRPQDDLYQHVNGTWIRDHRIPADRPIDGAFLALRDLSEERVRDIITDAPVESRIGSFYASFMDTDAVEAAGVAAIAPDLEEIDGATDADALALAMARLEKVGVAGLVGAYVNNDAKNSTEYILYLVQYGIGLPDESFYREDQYAELREQYTDHIARMFVLADLSSEDEARARADRIVALETRIAAAHWDVVARRDADKTYNPVTWDELPGLAPGFPWHDWAREVGGTEETFGRIVAMQPDFLTAVAELWATEPLETWKEWLRWRVLDSRAPYLTTDLVEEDFRFYGTAMSGTEEIKARWKRGVGAVEGALGEEVGKEYVARHFPPGHKARMVELVENLTAAYRYSIERLPWMTPATRERAQAKLEAFVPKIGYPDKWRDYSALEVRPDDLLGNVRRSAEFEHGFELGKLGGPVDRDEWHMTPQTVNAYYNPVMNEIVFPAAILQPPFFDADADDAANYGAIGAVIGHEIGHGFDDQGSKYDGEGNLVDWWTDEDRDSFGTRVDALIAQYQGLTPDGLDPEKDHVNGAFTVGENIGDLGGLTIALLAYRLAQGSNGQGSDGQPAQGTDVGPEIDGMTGIQRLITSWAIVWRTKTRAEEAARRLAVDPHSPPEFRCNQVVRNLDDFHAAFGVTEDDGLWLAPEERVSIW
ncbi:M13 family metallopeptidase [Dietzia sp. PP-33]|jgi:putative endopeptidase|uniref:M13 family metallopeptidase n=1 Tax=Dietzia sp. PP-33 TaxID=2957500 RepID=UPI0029A6D1FE|nr:M13-type metalloendopeptidase [Dietzia sp. PP-33]MDX2356312.1 peptidase M13 [Dietzia sp. PP-33]